jgi:cell wall-associated NlpC family hydrolase
MGKKRAFGLSAQRSLALIALILPALAACSLAPMRRQPDVNATVALAESIEEADARVPPAQGDPAGESDTAPRQDDAAVGAGAARHALEMVGAPYRYGGKTPKGLDCSGLVLYSYARAGKQLPPNTRGQRTASLPIKRVQMRPGDLLFFNLEGRQNSHVAVYVGDGEFVHAPRTGKVVSTANLSNPFWRRNLAGVRRPAPDQHLTRRGTPVIPSRAERPLRPEGI